MFRPVWQSEIEAERSVAMQRASRSSVGPPRMRHLPALTALLRK